MADISPVLCPCPCLCDFLDKFDKNIYDTQSTDTFLKALFDVICMEFCDIAYAKQFVTNDFYLWKDREEEPVIKGESHGIDCLRCKTVVEIISVGDTPGASDYEEGIDYEVHRCGVQWLDRGPIYYATYYSGSDTGRKSREPATGDTYYVTYRCGVRNEKLYDVFGVLVGLVKQDYQTYPDYRHAIRSLIRAYMLGPTIAGLKEALSIFTQTENVQIVEGYKTGWIIGESILYTKDDWEDPTMNVNDGTILKTSGADYEFDVDIDIYNALSLEDQELLSKIVSMVKPAHSVVFITDYTQS